MRGLAALASDPSPAEDPRSPPGGVGHALTGTARPPPPRIASSRPVTSRGARAALAGTSHTLPSCLRSRFTVARPSTQCHHRLTLLRRGLAADHHQIAVEDPRRHHGIAPHSQGKVVTRAP